MSLKIDTLPNDVLIRVFKELDACDIRRCSLTCRVFHEAIRDSVLLQYRLELAVAGLEDGGTECRLSIAERLAQLRTIEQGWAKLCFRQKTTVDLPQCHTWRLRGGVLAHDYAPEMPSVLSFVQLPSAIRGTPVHIWQIDMEVIMQQFAIDPPQDLVVLVAWPETPDGQWHTFLIHLRAMSTGERHPCATEPVLSCVPTLLDTDYSFNTQIMGDFLAILYRTPGDYLRDQLYVWDWKTGQLLAFLGASPRTADITSFSFLSLRHFITVRCTSEPDGCYQPELLMYDFIAARPEGSMEPRLVRIYQLPCLSQNIATSLFILGSGPPSEPPTFFYPTSCSRLLTVSMHFTYLLQEQHYVLFVHVPSLLEEVNARSNADQLTVPWENWGPLRTRMMPICDYRAGYHVYGTRYVQQEVGLDGDPWGSASGCRLRVLDFNPLALRRALSSQDTSLSPSEDQPELLSITIVQDTQPTIIDEHESAFTQRVSTALPYLDVIGRRTVSDAETMIDLEGVVHLGWDWWGPTNLEFLCI
ncbi:hypothetical protein JB92DRAFT_2881353 [Gautieria morchelliformis]|nr:hypothetical protein JB92DRAFT_2881353 [Gautieria morchelliformis]